MDFENGDYIINVEKLKAFLFDELMEKYLSQAEYHADNDLSDMIRIVSTIEKYGQKMG